MDSPINTIYHRIALMSDGSGCSKMRKVCKAMDSLIGDRYNDLGRSFDEDTLILQSKVSGAYVEYIFSPKGNSAELGINVVRNHGAGLDDEAKLDEKARLDEEEKFIRSLVASLN